MGGKPHGHCNPLSPTYRSWAGMKTRCTNKNVRSHRDYGAKGISFCSEWSDFKNFLRDMGIRPEGTTLERKNNRLGYSLENCEWGDKYQQANNRSNNKVVEIRGETLTLAKSVEKYAVVHYDIVQERLWKLGWNIEAALFTPKIDRVQNLKGKRNSNGKIS